jgi:hypothetical protein
MESRECLLSTEIVVHSLSDIAEVENILKLNRHGQGWSAIVGLYVVLQMNE